MAGGAKAAHLKDPVGCLEALPVLKSLPAEGLRRLIAIGEWVTLHAGDRLATERPQYSGDTYYIIQKGQLGLLHKPPETSAPRLPETPVVEKGKEFLTLLTEGDLLADRFLSDPRTEDFECMAVMETVLMAVPRPSLLHMSENYPMWWERLNEQILESQRRYAASREPGKRLVQDFYLRRGYSFAQTLKVIELGKCLECNACETACTTRHGFVRLQRKGPTLGRLGFPVSCRTCEDHRCHGACGFDAISFKEGEVFFDSKKCVGCTACQGACPNGVIEMIDVPYEVSDFPKPLPYTDAHGQTNVEGLYLAGEACGASLIKLAINQGHRAITHIAELHKAGEAGSDACETQVVIAGAGPAGLSAALACEEAGIDYILFDKGHYAQTIQTYPRDKVVMAEPAHIPKLGSLWMENTTKEELITMWKELIETNQLNLRSHEGVNNITKRDDGAFDVTTSKGEYVAWRVLLAPGTRGSPRKMGVPGEEEPRVQYVLTEPDEFAGKHVLVVGGGDSAVEAAMSLADVDGTTVSLSYRRDSFGRIKAGNKSRLAEYESEGQINVVLSSNMKEVGTKDVTLEVDGEKLILENDVVFAMLGAEPPTKFFKSIGVDIVEPGSDGMKKLADTRGDRAFANKCDHCVGFADQACVSACPTNALKEMRPEEVFVRPAPGAPISDAAILPGAPLRPTTALRKFVVAGLVLLTTVVATALGVEAWLQAKWPERSVYAAWVHHQGLDIEIYFSAGEGLGYYLGWAGMGLMTLTALYPLHSRLRWLSWMAKSRFWLRSHIIAGVLGPVFITYHTELKLDRWPSIAFWLAWAVVFSGGVGRFFRPRVYERLGLNDLANAGRLMGQERGEAMGGPQGRLARVYYRALGLWRPLHWTMTVIMLGVGVTHMVVALTYRAG